MHLSRFRLLFRPSRSAAALALLPSRATAAASAPKLALTPLAEMEASERQQHEHFMRLALEQGRAAHRAREVPIGCVIVRDDVVVGRGFNRTNETRNGTSHAEYHAIAEVIQRFGSPEAAEFHRCTLYVTCEPCIMCAGALALIGIGRVFFGCHNDKFGGCGSILHVHDDGCGTCRGAGCSQTAQHSIVAEGRGFPCEGGLLEEEGVRLLKEFYVLGNPNAPKPHRPLQAFVADDPSPGGGSG